MEGSLFLRGSLQGILLLEGFFIYLFILGGRGVCVLKESSSNIEDLYITNSSPIFGDQKERIPLNAGEIEAQNDSK